MRDGIVVSRMMVVIACLGNVGDVVQLEVARLDSPVDFAGVVNDDRVKRRMRRECL